MLLALALAAGLALWWMSRRGGRPWPAFGTNGRTIAGWAALALSGLLTLRGNLAPAALAGLAGLWLLRGPEAVGATLAERLKGAFGGLLRPRAPAGARVYRSRLIVLELGPDGGVAGARLLQPPRPLDAMGPADLRALTQRCRRDDPDGLSLLEAYLDRRRPGWRVDAQFDPDAGPGGPPQPRSMTQEEAYQVLGLERGATLEEVRAAHRALMKRAHPDQGGSAALAARINAARDRLTDRHR